MRLCARHTDHQFGVRFVARVTRSGASFCARSRGCQLIPIWSGTSGVGPASRRRCALVSLPAHRFADERLTHGTEARTDLGEGDVGVDGMAFDQSRGAVSIHPRSARTRLPTRVRAGSASRRKPLPRTANGKRATRGVKERKSEAAASLYERLGLATALNRREFVSLPVEALRLSERTQAPYASVGADRLINALGVDS